MIRASLLCAYCRSSIDEPRPVCIEAICWDCVAKPWQRALSAVLLSMLALGCRSPAFPEPTQRTPSGIGVSGVHLSVTELVSIDERVAATAECLDRVAVDGTETCPPTGRRVTKRVERVHVEPTCWIDVPGYSRPQRGTVHRGVVRVGRGTRALQHEASVIQLGGYHSHARCAPTILCEHAGPKPFPYKCEEKP